MHLLDLPSELIAKILEFLDGDDEKEYGNTSKPHLCALARTAPALYKFTQTILPRNLLFRINSSDSKDEDRVRLFNRSCAEVKGAHPGELARCVEIRWFLVHEDGLASCKIYDEFLRNISVGVIDLSVELNLGWSSQGPRYEIRRDHKPWALPSLLETGTYPNLRRLRMEMPDTTAKQVLHLVSMPSLEDFHVHNAVKESKGSARQSIAPDHSEITLLNFCWGPIETEALREILPCCPRLKEMKLSMPGRYEEIDRKTRIHESGSSSRPGYDLLDGFRVHDLQLALEPLRQTIVKLYIDADNVEWQRDDGFRLDLSHFDALSELRLNSAVAFGPELEPSHARLDLWKQLPRMLKSLQVEFAGNSGQGPFWSNKKMRSFRGGQRTTRSGASFSRFNGFDDLWNAKETSRSIGWLEALAEHKMERFPLLHKVEILVNEICDLGGDWKIVEWNVSNTLQSRMRQGGISVSGQTMVPKAWVPLRNAPKVIYEAE